MKFFPLTLVFFWTHLLKNVFGFFSSLNPPDEGARNNMQKPYGGFSTFQVIYDSLMRRKTQLRAEAVLFMQLVLFMGISAGTSASNLKQGESLHRTQHSLFHFICTVSEREALKFTFLSSLTGCVWGLCHCFLDLPSWLHIHVFTFPGTVTAQIPASMLHLNGRVCLRKMESCVLACACACVRCTACVLVFIKLFAFDAFSCGSQAASLVHSPLTCQIWKLRFKVQCI